MTHNTSAKKESMATESTCQHQFIHKYKYAILLLLDCQS